MSHIGISSLRGLELFSGVTVGVCKLHSRNILSGWSTRRSIAQAASPVTAILVGTVGDGMGGVGSPPAVV
jgi:hypothetical protein